MGLPSTGRPAAEVSVEPSLLRALLQEQHPDLGDLSIVELGAGWDNQLYRLGDTLIARLPRRAAAAALIVNEQRWLPELAPRLPLPVPVPLRVGSPGLGFPWQWSITKWHPGVSAAVASPHDHDRTALELGRFVSALHQPAPADAPRNPFRGVPLAERSAVVMDRISALDNLADRSAALARWKEALAIPAWPGPPLWIHGDLHPANVLIDDGHLSAVIDFGDLTAGDPATDLAIAWMLLPPNARPAFRSAARPSGSVIDDETWRRARGWALLFGLVLLASSRDDSQLASVGQTTIRAVLAE